MYVKLIKSKPSPKSPNGSGMRRFWCDNIDVFYSTDEDTGIPSTTVWLYERTGAPASLELTIPRDGWRIYITNDEGKTIETFTTQEPKTTTTKDIKNTKD